MTSRLQGVLKGVMLIAGAMAVCIGVAQYFYKPLETITIENCGKREYFRKKLDEEKIGYRVLPNGDFRFDVREDIDKLNALIKGDVSSVIPSSAESAQSKNCARP